MRMGRWKVTHSPRRRGRGANMREVSVIGVGMIPFAKYREKTLAEIGWPAVKAAIEDAGIDKKDIEAAYCGSALGGMMSGQRVLKQLGITGLPITNVENACSSSSSAFREAYIAVAASAYDVVLVWRREACKVRWWDAAAEKRGFWATGLVMPALYGMRAPPVRLRSDERAACHGCRQGSQARRKEQRCPVPQRSDAGRSTRRARDSRSVYLAALLPLGRRRFGCGDRVRRKIEAVHDQAGACCMFGGKFGEIHDRFSRRGRKSRYRVPSRLMKKLRSGLMTSMSRKSTMRLQLPSFYITRLLDSATKARPGSCWKMGTHPSAVVFRLIPQAVYCRKGIRSARQVPPKSSKSSDSSADRLETVRLKARRSG